MLLTITYTQTPATDLGYLLHKNPANAQSFKLPFGKAHVFYPEVGETRCSATLLLDLDTVELVRGKRGSRDGGLLEQYINDRPYVASSFMSVAISTVYGTAMTGRSKQRPELAETVLPLEAELAVVPCRGGEAVLRRLFEPLGYAVEIQGHPLDTKFPDWGTSNYYTLRLSGTVKMADLLAHLYVLIPVLDDDKHYYFADDEVDKLMRHGEGWLAKHPERELITRRYLKRYRLVREALARLLEQDSQDPDTVQASQETEEEAVEKPLSLNEQRMQAVVAALKEAKAGRVLDLGCGSGKLLEHLLPERSFEEIVGMDVSYRVLEIAADRLRLERLPERQRNRIKLLQGSLTYRDKRLAGYDAATVVEVIEHLDLPRLSAFERVLFEFTRPNTVILTTPNVEYNVKFETLPAGKLRHRDHRFEWTRAEFQTWAEAIVARFGYTVAYHPIGPVDAEVGPPTQMAIFTKDEG